MAVSRIEARTLPDELKRQAGRVQEQTQQLSKILNDLIEKFGNMSKMMANYNPKLVQQINNLKTALTSYDTKSKKIYGELAASLNNHGDVLANNLTNLTDSIAKVAKTIESL